MRLFIALDIDDGTRDHIARFIDKVRGFARDARWAKSQSLHVTLKFVGEQPEASVEAIKQALSNVTASAFEIQFRGYGFFPTASAARVFWAGIETGPELAALAAAIDEQTASLGIPKEDRPFSPHLTLARGGLTRGGLTRGGSAHAGAARTRSGSPHRIESDRPNRSFRRLQEELAALPAPEFGTMTAREFFLYRSQLSPKGSTYTKLASFSLR